MSDVIVKSEGNLQYMTYFRGFAIIMIVMVHCVTRFMNKDEFAYPYVYGFFVHSTNLFLFISGFLFEYLQYKNYSYDTFIKKKYKRLIVPYLFWALPTSLLLMVTTERDRSLEYIAWTLWTGLDHLNDAHWYIPFIFLVFLIVPPMRRILGKYLYYVVLPISLSLTLISSRAHLGWFYGQMTILPLIGMFFLGMFFAHYRYTLVHKIYKYDWVFVLLGLSIVVYQGYIDFVDAPCFENAILNLANGKVSLNLGAVNKLFFAIGFVLLFYRISLYEIKIPILVKLANYSFAIYFVHLYIAFCLSGVFAFFGLSPKGDLLQFVSLSILVLFISAVMIYFLRRINLIKNIVGV